MPCTYISKKTSKTIITYSGHCTRKLTKTRITRKTEKTDPPLQIPALAPNQFYNYFQDYFTCSSIGHRFLSLLLIPYKPAGALRISGTSLQSALSMKKISLSSYNKFIIGITWKKSFIFILNLTFGKYFCQFIYFIHVNTCSVALCVPIKCAI